MNVFDKAPVVDKDAFVAPSASIIGDVQVGRGSSVWYGCVLRGMYCNLLLPGRHDLYSICNIYVSKSKILIFVTFIPSLFAMILYIFLRDMKPLTHRLDIQLPWGLLSVYEVMVL